MDDEEQMEISRTFFHVTSWIYVGVTTWIICCVIANGIRRKKFVSTPGGKMYMACTGAIALSLPRLLFDAILFNAASIPGFLDKCETLGDIGEILYGLALLSTYTFLWLRQNAINSHPVLQSLNGAWLKIFSWVVLVLIFFETVVLEILYITPSKSYVSNRTDCVISEEANDLIFTGMKYRTYLAVGVVIQAFAQLSLIFLFVYPIFRSKFSHTNGCTGNREIPTMVRPLVCSIVVVLSDIAAVIATRFALDNSQVIAVDEAIFDTGIIVNTFGILGTFEGMARILWPFSKCGDKNIENPSCDGISENL